MVKRHGGEHMASRWDEYEALIARDLGSALPEQLDAFSAKVNPYGAKLGSGAELEHQSPRCAGYVTGAGRVEAGRAYRRTAGQCSQLSWPTWILIWRSTPPLLPGAFLLLLRRRRAML